MQLPRGKFRSVIKGVALHSLVQELGEVRYSGHVTITRGKEVILLVIQKGRYLLAEYGPLKGDRAWEGISALGESTIDAILTDLSDSELKLALEFNVPYLLSAQIVTRAFRSPREKGREPALLEKPAEAAAEAPAPPAPPRPVEKAAEPRESLPEPPKVWKKSDLAHAATAAREKGHGELTTPGYDEVALLHMEMSALDDVDVEHIATKIRKNARGIVKKLHLGHLMAEKEE